MTAAAEPSPRTPVLVTGGASGIGAACAVALAAVGRPAVLWDRDEPGTASVARQITETVAVPVVATGIDVADTDGYAGALREARSVVGPIGGFVHAAGVVDPTPVTAVTTEAWRRVLDVNLTAYASITAALADDLVSLPGSAVVGISSINATLGQGDIPSYSASKAGVLGLTRSMAAQFGPSGVRVNAVCPGYIDTPMLRRSLADERRGAQMRGSALLGRAGLPSEVASVVRFLLDEEAGFVTGSTVFVDGGVTASDRLSSLAGTDG